MESSSRSAVSTSNMPVGTAAAAAAAAADGSMQEESGLFCLSSLSYFHNLITVGQIFSECSLAYIL